MAKITINPIQSGNDLETAINDRLQLIEDTFNDNVLWRDGFVGEPNAMAVDFDLANNDILNIDWGAVTDGSGNSMTDYVQQAGDSAAAAATSETNAAASAAAAAVSEANAATSETNAAASATTAQAAVNGLLWQDVKFLTFADSPYNVPGTEAGTMYAIDTSGGSVVVNLAEISTITAPFTIGVKKLTADSNTVTINRGGSDLIDGATNKVITSAEQGYTLLADTDPTPDAWTSIQFGASLTNKIVDTFDTGVDFTPGTTTQLTLSNSVATENNLHVTFDGVFQHHTQYTVSGDVLTFSSAIPLQVVEIEVVYGGELQIGVPADNSVGTAQLQDLSVTQAKLAPDAKNLNPNTIINGNFEIWQRAVTTGTVGTDNYYADRFRMSETSPVGVVSFDRDTDTPTAVESGVHSTYSLKCQVTTATASLSGTESMLIDYTVEGYDMQNLWGKEATLSFWVKSSLAGTYCIAFQNGTRTRSRIFEYTIDVADTWEQKEITVTLDEGTGTWDFTNGAGMIITWGLAVGPGLHAGTGSWLSSDDRATSNQVNWLTSVGRQFRLSQVKLEPGNARTQFIAPRFEEELARCKRYYEKSYSYTVAPGTALDQFGDLHFTAINQNSAAQTYALNVRWDTPKANLSGTITSYSPITGTTGNAYDHISTGDIAVTPTFLYEGGFYVQMTETSTTTSYHCSYHYVFDGELT